MFDSFKNICGIYKINFPNNKSYIGLSSNIQKRMIAHHKTHDNLPVHRAIEKYGLKEENVQILEFFSKIDRKKLQEREKYWIAYYETYKEEKGYNLTLGGDGASEGIYNSSAKLNQEALDSLVQELIECKIFIKDLANKYGLSPEAISDINQGKRYYNASLSYPLRKSKKFTSEEMKKITGVNKSSSKFNEEQLLQIICLLKGNKFKMSEIANFFNCSISTISNINKGTHYYNPLESYPIRKSAALKISEFILQQIYSLLKDTNLSYEEISKKFNLARSTISRIDKGIYHHKDNIDYPIRKTK